MKIKKRDGSDERRILQGLVTDPIVVAKVSEYWTEDNTDGLFASPYANLVAKWSVTHFRKYGEPIGSNIEQRYESWSSKPRNKDITEPMASFLSMLSETHDNKINSQVLLDTADEYFNRVRLKRLADRIADDLDEGKVEDATNRISTFGRIEMATDSIVNVFSDKDALREVFKQGDEALLVYPGDLGKFFGTMFHRASFVAFMSPEKRGKTFWLTDVAYRAAVQRLRTIVFQCGDMSRPQMMKRIVARSLRRPIKAKTIEMPTKITRSKSRTKPVEVEKEELTFDKRLSYGRAKKEWAKWLKRKGLDEDILKLSVHPNDTVSAIDIETKLRRLEREGWVPDVVVIDYADILAAPPGTRELRDQINVTWKRLRAISQMFNCVLVTATQSDTASYDVDIIRRRNFSDDKRKLAHVTAIVGINQTDHEKDIDVTRLNIVVARDQEYVERRVIYVAGCRPAGLISVRSTF